ncbi:HAD family hydrolase [Allosalinactinospora lopnorensis]|uniref:HAD family hydrolase n=1 Tax=Allosalinactinospora lopnorensis TaxID=1352348 RepID=UPI0012E1A47E|nr:HAD-IA family hydrolase [Allosalinactinospora lopnorensis]
MVALAELSGVVFATDGVVTKSASLHAAAWKRTFDAFLRERSRRHLELFHPFDLTLDYLCYVNGRSHGDGIRSFLGSRGITLPEEPPGDAPHAASVTGLADRKERYFLEQLRRYGVAQFPFTMRLVHQLRRHGTAVAAVSPNRDCTAELRAAGVDDLFDTAVDHALDTAHLGLPAPGLFREAARRMGTDPDHCTVIESTSAGVEAARRGGFAFVIGVERTGRTDGLYQHGADIVVTDLAELDGLAELDREIPSPAVHAPPPGDRHSPIPGSRSLQRSRAESPRAKTAADP